MIVVGSVAAKFYRIDLKREPSDLDIIGTKFDYEDFIEKIVPDTIKESPKYPGKYRLTKGKLIIEFDATAQGSDQILLAMKTNEYVHFVPGKLLHPILNEFDLYVAMPKLQYMMKRSHANYNVNFHKTFFDIKRYQEYFMNRIAYCIEGDWDFHEWMKSDLYKIMKDEAKSRAKQSPINLKVSNEKFFEGSMGLREYIHDDIHKAVAHDTNHPMYEKCKKDMNSAYISRDLFEAMDYDDQLDMVCEEAMVIGIERFYNPDGKNDDLNLYRKGLLKLAHTLCKGWFQDFLLDNIFNLQEPRWKYLYKFEKARDDGSIRKIKN